MRFAATLATALSLFVFCCLSVSPAQAARFSHPDQGFELSLPDQWAEAAPRDNVYVYHRAGAPATEPPMLVVRIEPFKDAQDAERAAAVAAGIASRPQQAIQDAASLRLRDFTKVSEELDQDTGALSLEYTCAVAFHDGDVTGMARTIPSTKGLFLVGAMADSADAETFAVLEKALAGMDVEGQALLKGASVGAQIMQALEGRGLMLLLSLVLTILSLTSFFLFFRRDKTARTLLRHEREKRRAADKAKEE